MTTLYDRIKTRREQLNMSQEELARKLGYKSRSSINKIEKGENDIPQSKIIAFAEALNTTPSALMGWDEENSHDTQGYYTNPEAAQMAQELYDNPGMRILFDAAKNVSAEDLKVAADLIARMKKKEE